MNMPIVNWGTPFFPMLSISLATLTFSSQRMCLTEMSHIHIYVTLSFRQRMLLMVLGESTIGASEFPFHAGCLNNISVSSSCSC